MNDFVPAFLVTLVGTALAWLQVSRFPRWEATPLAISFAAHIVSAIVQIWFTQTLYGGGDLFAYVGMGETLSTVLRVDFVQFAPEVTKLLLHANALLPMDLGVGGSSSGAMAAIAGFLTFFTGGSTYTLCLIVAIAAYFGKVALYRAFSLSFPQHLHRRLILAATLVPSVVFWSSALLKEAVAVFGLGYMVLGFVRFRSYPGASAIYMILGAAVVALVKAYILFPIVVAAGAWFYFDFAPSAQRILRPVHLAIGAAIAGGGIILLGRIFPEYALENLAEQAAAQQGIGLMVPGASTYAIGDPTQTTLAGQLVFAPIALVTALFRPFLFESTSVQVAVNALETSTILFLVIRALFRRGFAGTWAWLSRSPMMVFCFLFTVTFGVAVGLTTTNLGTLSRYRMPLVPFFWALTLVLDARDVSRVATDASPRANARASRRNVPYAGARSVAMVEG